MKRVCLEDIAKEASVSIMTVSRALRNKAGVSGSTRDKILALARELGYVPNQLASNLAARRTQTIGVVIPQIEHTIYPAMVRGIEEVLHQHHYRLFLCCSYNQPEKEHDEVIALLGRRVDGIVMAPACRTQSHRTIDQIMAQDCPLVLMGRLVPEACCDSVAMDEYQAAYDVVSQMLKEGRSNPVHLAGAPNNWIAAERLRGFREALINQGLTDWSDRIVPAGSSLSDGQSAMEQILRMIPLPDAVFCCNNAVTLGAIRQMKRQGVRVPDEIVIAGYASTLASELIDTPMMAIEQNGLELGRQTAYTLIDRIENRLEAGPVRRVLPAPPLTLPSSLQTA